MCQKYRAAFPEFKSECEKLLKFQFFIKSNKLIGLILLDKGVLRHGQSVFLQKYVKVGLVTSGTFSPTLKKAIALARVEPRVEGHYLVEIRSKALKAKVVAPPFVRRIRE